MAYYNNDQLLKYFEKNMKQVADLNIETLKLEIKKLYQKEMSKIQEALTIKHELEKNRELKSLTIIHQEKINHLGIEYDETLMNLRKNMVADIFETVTKRIKSYMTTKAYITSMSHKIKTYADQYEHKNLILHIQASDHVLGDLIKKTYPSLDVQIHPNIVIGGFLLTVKNQSIEFDHTYDALLNHQKDVFLQTSKLFVRA